MVCCVHEIRSEIRTALSIGRDVQQPYAIMHMKGEIPLYGKISRPNQPRNPVRCRLALCTFQRFLRQSNRQDPQLAYKRV